MSSLHRNTLIRDFPPLLRINRRARGVFRSGFSLVELLVSITVLSVMLLMIVSLLSTTQQTWSSAKTRVSQFRDARVAFEAMTRNISQATLNTYLDYYDEQGNRIEPVYDDSYNSNSPPIEPDHYDRYSELHFLVDNAANLFGATVPSSTHAIFFQAPLGDTAQEDYRVLGNLLNARGYFVVFSDDRLQSPAFLRNKVVPKWRFRLMEYRPPSERNQIYETPEDFTDWYGSDFNEILRNSRVIADNVIALVISPVTSADSEDPNRFDIAPDYKYTSQKEQGAGGTDPVSRRQRHQLPPLLKITMVAMDEESANRLLLNEETEVSELVPAGLFVDAAAFDDDLKELEDFLAKRGDFEDVEGLTINYRIFSATVSIRGSKWSDEKLVAVPGG